MFFIKCCSIRISPVSVTYSLSRIDRYFADVIAESTHVDNVSLARYFKNLYSHIRYADVDDIKNESVQTFLADVRSRILEFSKRLAQSFFSYS